MAIPCAHAHGLSESERINALALKVLPPLLGRERALKSAFLILGFTQLILIDFHFDLHE